MNVTDNKLKHNKGTERTSAIDKTARSIWGKTIRAMKAGSLFLNQRQITTF